MNWNRFIPADVEYDWEKDKLAKHGVCFEEAMEAFFNNYKIRKNKRFYDRYQLIGYTDGGRKVKIIFQLKPKKIIRIITGWPIWEKESSLNRKSMTS